MRVVIVAALAVLAACTPTTLVHPRVLHMDNQAFEELIIAHSPIVGDPSGTYKGSKSILGQVIDATVEIQSATELKLSLSGVLSLECDEPYHMDGGSNMVLDNIEQDGDCAHDAMQSNNVKFKSMTYDATTDSITVKVNYAGLLDINFELDRASAFNAVAVSEAGFSTPSLKETFDTYFHIFELKDPSGKYSGSKSVLGQTINVSINVHSANAADLKITGPLPLECKNEPYEFKNGKIILPDIEKEGDCVHDDLEKNNVKFKGIKYNKSADEITISVVVFGISLDFVLKHEGALIRPSQFNTEIEWVIAAYYDVFQLENPSGKYSGEKSVLGQNVKVVVKFAESTLDFTVSGVISVSCSGEEYSVKGSKIEVPGASKAGDCVHDTLQQYQATLNSFTYDATSDVATIKIKIGGVVSVSIDLTK